MKHLSTFTKRKIRVRKRIKSRNKLNKPRAVVFRSNMNIYAQLIDVSGKVVTSYSSLLIKDSKVSGVDQAKLVGSNFAKLCIEKGFHSVVFDKGAYIYNGRVKALADSCREYGLRF